MWGGLLPPVSTGGYSYSAPSELFCMLMEVPSGLFTNSRIRK
ncbi:MAG TPA: hypothetical protein PLR88_09415 [Bacteroidales bacterium]|nr:hypothetical protein [Bacteroidales bacterium]